MSEVSDQMLVVAVWLFWGLLLSGLLELAGEQR